jgi:hypothetical protein
MPNIRRSASMRERLLPATASGKPAANAPIAAHTAPATL